ncbi:type III pantothenate kinase [Neolewinella xylanilytica]|uniref:Type III pantothenate kinase n=1 Tax=Neolewinella xylanilytica TaxID=1514080 RepID=A0A2S6I179_9BACT|nr:type III pantothenate kinase [Neolewinella xylanilytica]PPK84712.1 type III pantothenate kinase [Neolewinella xylanilytica]
MNLSTRQLVIDIGNSGIKAAIFVEDELESPVHRLDRDDWAAIDGLATNPGVKNIIYSTVANVPPDRWIDKWKNSGRGVYTLDRRRNLPFASEYRSPETLGQDRIAVVAGTLGRFTTARLIVDAGSCVTLDLVDADGRYLGGNISPGVGMRLRAMHEGTARLPLIPPGVVEGEVGLTTETALRHGGLLGVVYEIEGLFLRLRERHPELQLVLTGGDAPLLSPHFSIPFHHSPQLVLRGLNQILSSYVNEAF